MQSSNGTSPGCPFVKMLKTGQDKVWNSLIWLENCPALRLAGDLQGSVQPNLLKHSRRYSPSHDRLTNHWTKRPQMSKPLSRSFGGTARMSVSGALQGGDISVHRGFSPDTIQGDRTRDAAFLVCRNETKERRAMRPE